MSLTTTDTKKACMDCMCNVARKSLSLAETRSSPSQMKKTFSDKPDDAKQIVMKLNAKTSIEPASQERMSRPQVSQEELHSSREIILEVQPLKENKSLVNACNGDSSKEDTTSVNSITTRSVSNKEKILSPIQKENGTPQELKLHMDKCLPISLDMANIQESSEEDEGYFRENSRDKGNFTSLDYLPGNLQARKNPMEDIRGTKNNIRKLLFQLYEAIELTYQSKQGSEDQQNYHKALFKMWINWNRSQSENVNGDLQVSLTVTWNINVKLICLGIEQLVEALTLDMTRAIALKLQLAFMDIMPQVQGLPSSLQDKLQQACYDMQELYNTLSLSNGFGDLDKHHLTQSQLKLTQAQGSIEKLFCFLEGGTLPGWIVRSLSTSEYPFPEVLTLPKEKAP